MSPSPTKITNNLLKFCTICTFKVIFRHQKSTESFWFFFCEEYLTKRSTFINEIFWKLWFLKYFVFWKCDQFLSALFIILVGFFFNICTHCILNRYRPRFFIKLGIKPCTYEFMGDNHFFTKQCHRQTYQNYKQIRQKLGTFLENKVI